MRMLFALSLLLFAAAANAENGVLVGHLPSKAEPSQVLRIAQQALVNHKWTVTGNTDGSVSASLDRRAFKARISISLSADKLVYEGQAKTVSRVGAPQITDQPISVKTPAPIPTRWLDALRRDIGMMLTAIPDR